MRGFAGIVVVVEHRTLVKQRRLGRVEIFGRRVLVERAPAEGDHPPAAVADREHHPVAETVVGHGDVLAMDQKPGLDHDLDGGAFEGERVAHRIFVRRSVADAEMLLHRGAHAAIGKVAARLGPLARLQASLEEAGGEVQHLGQPGARLAGLAILLALHRHRHAGHLRQPLDRFRKAQPLRLAQETENVAVLARREIVIKAFLIIDIERWRLFRPERRQSAPLPALLLQLDALPRHLGDRQAGADFVKKGGREIHGRNQVRDSRANTIS